MVFVEIDAGRSLLALLGTALLPIGGDLWRFGRHRAWRAVQQRRRSLGQHLPIMGQVVITVTLISSA